MKPKLILFTAGGVAALAVTVQVARTCMVGILAGIHFRGTPVDFGAPPPRYSAQLFFDWARPDEYRAGTILLAGNMQSDPNQSKQDLSAGLQSGLAQEQAGDYPAAIATYRNLNRHGYGMTAFFSRRIPLLERAERSGMTPELKQFLCATSPVGPPPKLPAEESAPDYLKPYIAYEVASRLYEDNKMVEAAAVYRQCADKYRQSPLREDALIMAARCLLIDNVTGIQVDRKVTKDEIAEAEGILTAFLREFPHSRFAENAQGWLARCVFLAGDYPKATESYEALLSHAANPQLKDSCLLSLIECYKATGRNDMVAATWLRDYAMWHDVDKVYVAVRRFDTLMSGLSADESKRFRQMLIDQPDLAASYLTIRLDLMNTKAADRSDLAKLGEEVVQRNPKATAVWARLAEMAYMDGDVEHARLLAQSALSCSTAHDDNWALAEYLLGSTSMRMGRFDEAAVEYKSVCSTTSYLANGASETLVYLYDKTGDLDSALQQCYALEAKEKADENEFSGDYSEDAAYLLDVKMAPAEIQAMIASHPSSPHLKEWIYSLGLRYLRKEQFGAATAEFKKIPEDTRRGYAGISKSNDNQEDPLQDPLQTTKDLAQLTYDADHAPTADARAAALYRKASYYYERRGLLLYNYIAWQYGRVMSVDDGWNDSIASPRDLTALHDHEYDHECLVHAIDLCKELVKRYPNTPTAPSAVYREACALERLGNENEWWRWEGGRTRTAFQASELMSQLPKLYPKSPLSENAAKYADVFKKEDSDVHDAQILNKWPTHYKVGWYGR